MSGGGGGGGSSYPVQAVAPNVNPVPTANLTAAQGPAFGPTDTPQTWTPEAAPSWMKGGAMDLVAQGYQGMPSLEQYGLGGKAVPNWYQMPSWGTNAVTGEPMTQEQLNPAYGPSSQQAATPDWGAGDYAPRAAGGGWMDQYKAGVMDKGDATKMLLAQGLSNLEAQRRLNTIMRHPRALAGSRPLVDWG